MAELVEEFINIWNDNCNILSIQPYEFEKFVNVINKLRNKSKLDIQEKKIFIELIEIMAETIYTINNCADKYETTYYQQTKKYDEAELNCCSSLLNYLESEIYYDLENKYDIAFTNQHLKTLESNNLVSEIISDLENEYDIAFTKQYLKNLESNKMT